MNSLLRAHCETGHFSHGYLLIGDSKRSQLSVRKAASIILEHDEFSIDSHSDFLEQFFDLFTLNESRELLSKAAMKPIFAAKRVFSLGITSMTYEAALSLSKILEEPPSTCYFFFLMPFGENVPEPLRSRLLNIFEGGNFELDDKKRNFYEKFLESGSIERLSLVKNISSDKRLTLEFLNELEVIFSERLKKERKPQALKNLILFLDEIKANRQFLFDRAPSPKMIIEHFALTLPQLK